MICYKYVMIANMSPTKYVIISNYHRALSPAATKNEAETGDEPLASPTNSPIAKHG